MTVDRTQLVRDLYQAFNDRDLEAVLAAMVPDVEWPNGWEGGLLHGRDMVRDYWERQWGAAVRIMIVVRRVSERTDGTVEAKVRLVARDSTGTVLSRSEITHVFAFEGELVRRMTPQ